MMHKTEMLRNLGLLRRGLLRPVSSTLAARTAIGRLISNRGYRSCGHCKCVWYCGGPCPTESKAAAPKSGASLNDESMPKPDETEREASYERRSRKVRTFLVGAVVIAGISSAIAYEWRDRENERENEREKERKTRESRESRDLKICIMKALGPYVPPSIGFEGATDLVHLTPAMAEMLQRWQSRWSGVLVMNAPWDHSLVEIIQKHFAGQSGIIDMTTAPSLSESSFVKVISTMVTELPLYSATADSVIAETAAAAKFKGIRPTVLVSMPVLPADYESSIEFIQRLERNGFSVLVATHSRNVAYAINRKAVSCYLESAIPDAKECAIVTDKVQQYLLSEKSGVGHIFEIWRRNPPSIEIASAIGRDIHAIHRFISTFRSKSNQLTVTQWLNNEIFNTHMQMLQAITAFPKVDQVSEFAAAISFDPQTPNEPKMLVKYDEMIEHLVSRGLVWKAREYHSYFYPTSPLLALAWKKHTAKCFDR